MSFPRYSTYKDSGVEWLGNVPAHWEVSRLGAIFRQANDGGEEDLAILSVSIHDGVSDKELNEEEMDRKVTRSEDRTKYKKVQPGDLVYNMMRAWQGGFGAVTTEGMVSPAYVVARPIVEISTEFVERLLRTPQAIEQMRRLSHGVTDFRLRLYWQEFKSIRIAIPPSEDKIAIAAFLDRETSKIDALVAEQQRLIELLKEKRQAVISNAVTKGLNPGVPMKPSGLRWLGDLPAKWGVVPLKYICILLKDGTHLPPARVDDGVPLLSVRNIMDGTFSLRDDDSQISDEDYRELCKAFIPQPSDVLLAIVGATLGKTSLIPSTLGRFHIQRSLAIFRTRENLMLPAFLHLVFQSQSFQSLLWELVGFSAQPGIYLGTLQNLRIPVPPLYEQRRIVEDVVSTLSGYDTLISEAQQAIELLQERRTALISAAVTGKIDVRGLVNSEVP